MTLLLLNWTHEYILKSINNHEFLVETANIQRRKLPSSPEQSEFRVYCLLIVEVLGELIVVEGSNAEQGYIGGNVR